MAIHQEITLSGSRSAVYEILTTSKLFSEFTGAPAEINAVEGGEFSCFAGQIVGRNVELKADQRVVQAWRAGPWPEGVYSIVSFTLEQLNDHETKLSLDHSGFPDGEEGHLEGGWHKMYWEPLQKYCG